MDSMMWEHGVSIVTAAGHDLTPRLVATPSAWQVTSLAGLAPVAGLRSS